MQDSLIIEGKEYISSRRAAEMTRYSRDYVGQLARKGLVEGHMVGRSLFVLKQSILDYSDTALQALSERKFSPHVFEVPIRTQEDAYHVPSTFVPEMQAASHGLHITKGLVGALVAIVLSGTLVAGAVSVPGFFGSDPAAVLSSLEGTLSSTASTVVSSLSGVKDDSLALASSAYTATLADTFSGLWCRIVRCAATASSAPSVPSATTLVSNESPVPVTPLASNGLVVIPSSQSTTSDAVAIQQIKSSFSDNVNVYPDAQAGSGVIVPVFQKSTGDKYVYVMVPVNQKSSP